MNTQRTDDMRKAVVSGEWPAVLRLWDVYTAGILEEIGRGTCSPARMTEARESWTGPNVSYCVRGRRLNTASTRFTQPGNTVRSLPACFHPCRRDCDGCNANSQKLSTDCFAGARSACDWTSYSMSYTRNVGHALVPVMPAKTRILFSLAARLAPPVHDSDS